MNRKYKYYLLYQLLLSFFFAFELERIHLLFGHDDLEDPVAVAADDLAGLAEEEDPVGGAHVELEALAPVLHQLRK